MVEGRLVATFPAESHHHLQVGGKTIPALGLEAEAAIRLGPPGSRAAGTGAGVGERRFRRRQVVGGLHGVEQVEHRPQFGDGRVGAGWI